MVSFCLSLGLCAFALSLVFCLLLIPLLKRRKVGQEILSYVTEHRQKSGTPTMGGIAFIAAATLACLLLVKEKDRLLYVTLAIGFAFLLVGFLDDFLKLRHKRNEGLKPYQKIFFQLSVALIAGVFCFVNGYTLLYIPFTGFAVDIGALMIPLSVFVFLATVNCVNLTDGLDGLAASSCVGYFFCFSLLIILQGEYLSLAFVGFALVGALLAFLLFNTNKASVFMGDTGSLALGGFAGAVGVFSGNLLAVALIGFVFVLSGITVILQVIYYKCTRRRIFPMAPIHHTFQKMGHSEAKISFFYFLSTLFLGTLVLLFYC